MDPLLALLVTAGIAAATALIGLVWRARDGRGRRGDGGRVTAGSLGLASTAFGSEGTLLQFSTEMCARCPGARRALRGVADEHDGVLHAEVDLTHHPELATRFGILQTPTTLVLDRHGIVRTRIGGLPRREEVERAVHALSAPRSRSS
ncbi:MAG: thioredoxin family protein [Naasia sp.]